MRPRRRRDRPARCGSRGRVGRRAVAQQMLGGCPDDARAWRAPTRWSGSSSAGRSRRSRPFATGSPRRTSPSRRSRRRCAAGRRTRRSPRRSAKATAGRTAETVATHCQQVLAGIGFTTDHPFHRFLKRTMLLEGLFGSADDIATDIGRQLLAARRVPTLIEL